MVRPSISVCFPVFNEQDNIERAVSEAAEVLRDICDEWEIVAVNDASTDRTAELLDGMAATMPQLKVVHLAQNTRFAGALRRALTEGSCDYLFYTDSDCPVDMNDIRRALPMMDQADIVIGFRSNRDEGLRRAIYSRGYNALVRGLFDLRVRDVNFAFKLFRREVIQRSRLEARGSFVDAELLLEGQRNGYRIAEIGVPYFPRVAGVSTLASVPIAVKCFVEMAAYRLRRYRAPATPRPANEGAHLGPEGQDDEAASTGRARAGNS